MKLTPAQKKKRIQHRIVTLRKQVADREETIKALEKQLEPLLTPQEHAARVMSTPCTCDGTTHTLGFGCI